MQVVRHNGRKTVVEQFQTRCIFSLCYFAHHILWLTRSHLYTAYKYYWNKALWYNIYLLLMFMWLMGDFKRFCDRFNKIPNTALLRSADTNNPALARCGKTKSCTPLLPRATNDQRGYWTLSNMVGIPASDHPWLGSVLVPFRALMLPTKWQVGHLAYEKPVPFIPKGFSVETSEERQPRGFSFRLIKLRFYTSRLT